MKWYYLLILLLLISGLVFVKCSFFASKIVYVFENNNSKFEFQTTDPDTVIKEYIDFSTMELSTFKKEPIWFSFIYSENTPNVTKLKSIKIALLSKNDQGEFKEYPSNSELKIEYYDGKYMIKKEFKNNTAPLNTLVDWKAVNYMYEFLNKEYVKDKNNVTYSYSYRFSTNEYPDTLKLVTELVWENGTRKQEMFLHKEKYEGRKLNVKY